MKHVLIAHPTGARLYELTDDEFARFEHLLALTNPARRGYWAQRFLAERVPAQVFPAGALGADALHEIDADRVIGGNFFTPKWGRIQDGRDEPDNLGR